MALKSGEDEVSMIFSGAVTGVEKYGAQTGITKKEALELISAQGEERDALLRRAADIRKATFRNKVRLCAIVNAKSGRCPEKCHYCSQSIYFKTEAPVHPLLSADKILKAALRAEKDGASEFSIVTSGRAIWSRNEVAVLEKAIRLIEGRTALQRCASLGELPPDILAMLKEAGLQCYHHNIETAPSFHSQIVFTHTFDDEVRVIENAREAGLITCCGGIFGMGESSGQRVELIYALRDINPDFIPLNFLNPLQGTPLENLKELTPGDCLKIIAVTRLAMPAKPIFVCGGREANLKDLQWKMLDAGASGAMVGDYLTTKGRAPDEDRQMIEKAGYEIER
jgi:biotin synthase